MTIFARSVMTHTNSIQVFGGLLLAIPLLTMVQDRVQARENLSELQSSLHAGSPQKRSPSIMAPRRPESQERNNTGLASEPAGQSPSDMDVTRQIRRVILDDESLSTYAHNVMIIARNGEVTLKGPVRSAQEKVSVGEKAASVVGREKVKNEIEVSPRREP